jgi:hypothetical protein
MLKANGWQVIDNRFDGSGTTYRPTGLILSGADVLVASNRFSSIPTGITLLGKDSDWGTRLGVTTNPQLIANRFCDSKTPVETQPMVTGVSEQGTVLCPFPDPTLTITTAVILSWPDYTAGWILETAANATGPWVAFADSPNVQDGQNAVVVDSSTQQRFFRLRQP